MHPLTRRLSLLRRAPLCLGTALLLLGAVMHPCGAATSDDAQAPVVFRFATVGDSRADPKSKDLNGQDRRWVQNTTVLSRMLGEIEASHAQALMFNGDMVMGYTTDAVQLEREYAYWRGMVAGLMERGTYVLPVPGNHEMQMPTPQADGSSLKLAQPELAKAWRSNMGDLIVDTPRWERLTGMALRGWDPLNTPTVGTDGISTAQDQLSYSLDAGPVHIAVINTDPVGHDGSAPVEWLRRDFMAAQLRGARRFFVFGHKMAFAYLFSERVEKESGMDQHPAERDAFWTLIEEFGATYFCGHEHIYHASQPLAQQGGKAWQVIVGSGGSPFTAKPGTSTNPNDRLYAWAEVAVHGDGATDIVVRGFDEHLGPTRVIESWQLR